MPINSLLSFIVSGICSVSRLKNHLVTKEVTNKQLFYFFIYNKVVRKHASYCFSQERFFYIKITTIYFTEYQPKRKTSVKKNTYSLKIFLWIICQFQKSSYLCIRNRETNTDSRKQKQKCNTGWPVRLSVRTQDFHSWKGGSIPPRATS